MSGIEFRLLGNNYFAENKPRRQFFAVVANFFAGKAECRRQIQRAAMCSVPMGIHLTSFSFFKHSFETEDELYFTKQGKLGVLFDRNQKRPGIAMNRTNYCNVCSDLPIYHTHGV